MVLPSDSVHQGKVLARPSRRMSFVAEENLKRVLRAKLSLVQAQEFLRLRFQKNLFDQGCCAVDLFKLVDRDEKGSMSIYDLERLLINHKRSGVRSLVTDIELLIALYDKTGSKRITLWDFQAMVSE